MVIFPFLRASLEPTYLDFESNAMNLLSMIEILYSRPPKKSKMPLIEGEADSLTIYDIMFPHVSAKTCTLNGLSILLSQPKLETMDIEKEKPFEAILVSKRNRFFEQILIIFVKT